MLLCVSLALLAKTNTKVRVAVDAVFLLCPPKLEEHLWYETGGEGQAP